jgi:hypothetical protein
LVAEPACRLAGRVLDEAGKPVEGASLILRGECRTWNKVIAITNSGFDGSFNFDALAPQPAPVELVACLGSKSETVSKQCTIAAGGPIEDVTITLHRPAFVEGRVLDAANAPQPGVYVEVLGDSDLSGAMTDRMGRFRLSDLSSGEHELCVVTNDDPFPNESSPKTSVRLAAGERRTGIEIRLDAKGSTPGTISGRVVRSDGRLAGSENLEVELTSHDGSSSIGGESQFEFHSLEAGTYRLRAFLRGDPESKDGNVPWFLLSKELVIEPGGPEVALRLPELSDVGTFQATFVSKGGAPVPATVSWMVSPVSEGDTEARYGFGAESALKNGRFALRGFPPGEFKLTFEFDSGQEIECRVSFHGRETADLGEIPLDVASRCHGVVSDPTGVGIEGVQVLPLRFITDELGTNDESGPREKSSEMVKSDAEGRFDVALGRGSILFFKPGFAPRTWLPPEPPASTDEAIHITLLPAGHIRFQNIPESLTSSGANVHLRWLADEAMRAGYEATESSCTTSSLEDSYGIFNVPVGDYELWVWSANQDGKVIGHQGYTPPNDLPGFAHHWQVHVTKQETTRVDVGKNW